MRVEGPWTPWRRDVLIRSHGGLVDPTTLETFDSIACATLRTLYTEVRTLNRQTYYGDRFGFDADIEAVDLILLSVLDQAKVNGWSTDKTKAQGFQWMVAVITVFLVFDLEQLPNASHYQGSHPAPVHRAIITAGAFSRTFAREFGWTEEEREFFEDSAWEAVSDIAEQLGLTETRWWGTETAAMDLELYNDEEKLFLEFEAWISASNTGGPGDPPDWLRR